MLVLNLLVLHFAIALAVSPLPGENFVVKSVNIFKMNGLEGSKDAGFGKDLFTLKFNRGKDCIKGGYILADAICSDYTPIENTDYTEFAGHIKTSSDYQLYASKYTEFEKSVSVSGLETDINFFGASLQSSQEFSFAAEFATNHASNIVIKRAFCYSYRVVVSDYIAPDKLGYFGLDPELVQSIAALPVDGSDLTPYVKWLFDYGTHRIKEITTGAVLTETSYFVESDYNIMVKEVADVEVSAQESTWSHTTQKSGSFNESVQASTFDKYCHGTQHISAHGEIPLDNDPSGWLEKVRQFPVPVRMEITPIYDLYTPSWFDDPQILKKGINAALATQDYCNPKYDKYTGGCFKPPVPPPLPSWEQEQTISGITVKLMKANEGICVPTQVSRSTFDYCGMYIAQNQPGDTNYYWYLTSAAKAICSARCSKTIKWLSMKNATNDVIKSSIRSYTIRKPYTQQGSFLVPLTAEPTTRSICMLSWVENQVGCGDMWRVYTENGISNIYMATGDPWDDKHATLNSKDRVVNALCLNVLSTPKIIASAYTDSISGMKKLALVDDAVCFLEYVQGTGSCDQFGDGGTCRVKQQQLPGLEGVWWTLEGYTGSDPAKYNCIGTCKANCYSLTK